MPREIKFRAKELEDDREWLYGLIQHIAYANNPLGIEHLISENLYGLTEVDPATVGQYTGLRDSKRTAEYPEGQEIYEGDITDRGTVEYWKGKFLVVMRNDQCWDDLCWCHGKITVIGNIHDNTGGQLNE